MKLLEGGRRALGLHQPAGLRAAFTAAALERPAHRRISLLETAKRQLAAYQPGLPRASDR